MLPIFNAFFIGRVIGWIVYTLRLKEVQSWLLAQVGLFVGLLSGLGYWLFPTLWEKAYKEMEADIKTAVEIASGPTAAIVKGMIDMPVTAGMLASIASGGLSDADRNKIGDWFVDVFDQVFQEDPIAAGYLARDPGTAERLAFRKFVGRNAQLQLGGAMIDVVKDRLPKGLTLGLGDLVERMEKIMGFSDSQEEIMEPLMEEIIIKGLTKRYNRIIKSVDLAPGDAIDAYIRAYINGDTLTKILNNEGIRDDIRPILINLKAKNLTESDFRDLYKRGAWARDDVFAGFRANGYLEDDAQEKTRLIQEDRLYQLIGEQENVIAAQAVKGVIATAEYEAFLRNHHWLPDEVAVMIDIVERKKTLQTITATKKVTGSFNVAPWRVKPGASAMMSWNIRNADDVTISGIGTVPARGERVIQPDVSQTYTLTGSNDLGTETFQAAVQVGETAELKRPTVSFSAAPGRVTIGMPVELKWSSTNADSVSIDGVGAVAEAGAVAVYPFQSTVYTIRATNAQGTTVRQDIVFVSLPDIDLEKERRPAIAFSVTPGVVKSKQPQTELTWRLTRAESGTLEFPDGSKRNVGRNGALIFTATESGIFTLKANNLFGETQNQQAVIFEGGEDEEPPPPPGTVPPTLFMSVSPMTAVPNENLFVFWSITGATVGTLITPDGNSRQVGASGNENYVAPPGAGSYEFRLTASNDAGPTVQSVVVVVSAL